MTTDERKDNEKILNKKSNKTDMWTEKVEQFKEGEKKMKRYINKSVGILFFSSMYETEIFFEWITWLNPIGNIFGKTNEK